MLFSRVFSEQLMSEFDYALQAYQRGSSFALIVLLSYGTVALLFLPTLYLFWRTMVDMVDLWTSELRVYEGAIHVYRRLPSTDYQVLVVCPELKMQEWVEGFSREAADRGRYGLRLRVRVSRLTGKATLEGVVECVPLPHQSAFVV